MHSENFHCLGQTSVEEFLTHYWQKKPLLVKNAFPGISSPLSAEELAGLSCEENVNARLVLEKDGDYPWQAEHGPFEESRFSQLPDTHWSLLVSDMEKYLPETRSLIEPFQFLPDWRLDDLMISYAPEGGSVGAHVDDYDVFLVQLSGQRLWKIAENFNHETLSDVDLRILKHFESEQEWLCESGDLLYLPPNVAHHGVAQRHEDNCMTASIGFRAPSLKTMTSDYVNFLNENIHNNERFTDSRPVTPEFHAEITDDTVSQFIDYLKHGLTFDHEQVKRWLGQYRSDNKASEDFANESQDVNYQQLLTITSSLMHSPYSKFLFSFTEHAALVFVDGESYESSRAFAEILCENNIVDLHQLQTIMTAQDQTLLLSLYNDGAIIAIDEV